jgi:hypothetical protein
MIRVSKFTSSASNMAVDLPLPSQRPRRRRTVKVFKQPGSNIVSDL